jgi:hypothetical protein
MRIVVFVAVVAAMTSTAWTQTGALDVPVSGDFVIDNLEGMNPCAYGVVIDQIARQARVSIGFETMAGCWLSPRSRENRNRGERLTGMTARQALNHFVADVPTYRWQELDGVAVVRPKAAWDDRDDVLNAAVPPLSIADAHVSDVLDAILKATSPVLFWPHSGVRSGRPIDYPISVAFEGGRLIDALDAVVNATGKGTEWQLGYAGSPMLTVGTLEWSGGTVMIPLLRSTLGLSSRMLKHR